MTIRFLWFDFIFNSCIIQLDRDLVEAVGNAHPYCENGRNPDPDKVEKLLKAGAQPDFVMPWLPTNKRRR